MKTGDRVIDASTLGTVVFAVSATLGVVGSDPVRLVSAIVAGLLFVVGCGAFVAGFLAGVGRSRTEDIDMAGLFFLSGTAPRAVRRRLRGLVIVQVAIALTAAGLRPFTESAFGVLAPMFGFGLMALWGGRNGDFTRPDPAPAPSD